MYEMRPTILLHSNPILLVTATVALLLSTRTSITDAFVLGPHPLLHRTSHYSYSSLQLSRNNPNNQDTSTQTTTHSTSDTQRPQRRRQPRATTTSTTASSRRRPSSLSRRRAPPSTKRDSNRPSSNNNKHNHPNQEPFDPKTITQSQKPNLNAPTLSLCSNTHNNGRPPPLRPRSSPPSSSITTIQPKVPNGTHLTYHSLDSLFPNLGFSQTFCSSPTFRSEIRLAIRRDVFDSTPAYQNLTPKAQEMVLDGESSLQGSWECRTDPNNKQLRMKRLTRVLYQTLGPNAPSGDEFMTAIGALCGCRPSTHWMDIVGRKDRRLSHSWHQDTGRSGTLITTDGERDDDVDDCNGEEREDGSRYTVMLGFPTADYAFRSNTTKEETKGTVENDEHNDDEADTNVVCGVFSHVVKLDEECVAENEHPLNKPVLFEGIVDEEYIVRPGFGLGMEIVRYRDVDVLHSAPDVQYRTSVMRFM